MTLSLALAPVFFFFFFASLFSPPLVPSSDSPGFPLFSSPPPPFLLLLSLSVNENVLTRKKDLLGVAHFISTAEVRKRGEKKIKIRHPATGPSKKSYSCAGECLMRQ